MFPTRRESVIGLLRSRVAKIKRGVVGERSAAKRVQLAWDATLVRESTSD